MHVRPKKKTNINTNFSPSQQAEVAFHIEGKSLRLATAAAARAPAPAPVLPEAPRDARRLWGRLTSWGVCRLSSVEAARASDELPSTFTPFRRESPARRVVIFTSRSMVTTVPSRSPSSWGVINHLPPLSPMGSADSARLFVVITGGFERREVTTTFLSADAKSPESRQVPMGSADSARLFAVITGGFERREVTTTSFGAEAKSPESPQAPMGSADSARLFSVITGGFERREVTTTSFGAEAKSPASRQAPMGSADSARLFAVITGGRTWLEVITSSFGADEKSPASSQDPACAPRFPVVPRLVLRSGSSPVLADRADGVQTFFVRRDFFTAAGEECIRPLGTRGTDAISPRA